MIRPATLMDVHEVFELLHDYSRWYDRLKTDPERMLAGIRESISAAKHFSWVSTSESGKVLGVLIGLTGDNLWAARGNCNIVAWISRINGDGASLLRKFAEWVKSRRFIRVAGMCPDLDNIDPRAWKLAERIGFERHGGAYLLYN